MSDGERLDAEVLARFGEDVFTEAGLASDPATVLTDALVTASLRGVDTHGIARFDPYSRKVQEGGYTADPDVRISTPRDSVALVDADTGPGPYAALQGMEEAIAIAGDTGVGAAVVGNSNHFGMAAYYTLAAADEGYVGVAMSHGGPRVAPTGGVDPFFGTSPIAYSVPTDRDFHITHDMATSAGSNSAIRHARERGQEIPAEWALDSEGHPTTNPNEVHALQPVGGAKGYGLGLFVELCTGLLSGSEFAPEVSTPTADFSEPMRIGHLLLAIDVEAFRDPDAFRSDVGTLIDRLKEQRTVAGVEEIRLPGERAARTAQERSREGIPIDEPTKEKLESAADRFGLAYPGV